MSHPRSCNCSVCDGQRSLRRAMRGVITIAVAWWVVSVVLWPLDQLGDLCEWWRGR